jgi:hypothetical protein
MCIAATTSVAIAQADFDVALKQYPDDRLSLRNGITLMRDSERERGNSQNLVIPTGGVRFG